MLIRDVRSQDDITKLMQLIGVTDEGISYMRGKGVLRILQIDDLDTRGANIFKQESLAIGADLALPRSAAGFQTEKVDAILMANDKQIGKLISKLKAQPFGLKDAAARLSKLIINYDKEDFKLVSPHGRELVLEQAVVMGVLNVTPDSFSDGGRFCSADKAVSCAKEMFSDGAAIIDIGGESTGPGSQDVSLDEELARVIPVITAVRKELPDVFISIDTCKFAVAQKAIEAGADMINDVTAGRNDMQILDMNVPIVLMYSKDDTPRTTKENVQYDDVMRTIVTFLEGRIAVAKSKQIIVDPGMGAFVSGDPKYSFEILKKLAELKSLGLPILVGASRKSFLGGEVSDRLESSTSAAVLAVNNGAKIIRAHNVAATFKALNIFN